MSVPRLISGRPALTPLGPVSRADALYIQRPGDKDLLHYLNAGVLCYVLGPRQIGKTSLRMRVTRELEKKNKRCAAIDLTLVGKHDLTADDWYFSVISEISKGLNLPDPISFWEHNQRLSVVARWVKFLETEVVAKISEQVILFIDEIDNLLEMDFRTDFFASLRGLCQEPATQLPQGRLTFCLLGVAQPLDLCPDPSRTPFNVGREIRLADFTLAQALDFEETLRSIVDQPDLLLQQVLDWTGGHPAMTQRLCDALMEEAEQQKYLIARTDNDEKTYIQVLVRRLFVQEATTKDPILAEIAGRFKLFEGTPSSMGRKQLKEILLLYQRIRKQEIGIPLVTDSTAQRWLQLIGLCAERTAGQSLYLAVRNRIVRDVFDRHWVDHTATKLDLNIKIFDWKQDPYNSTLLDTGQDLVRAQQMAARGESSADELLHLRASESAERRKRRKRLLIIILVGLLNAMVVAMAVYKLAKNADSERYRQEAADRQRELAKRDQEVTTLKGALAEVKLPVFAQQEDVDLLCALKKSQRDDIITKYRIVQQERQANIEKFDDRLREMSGKLEASLSRIKLLQQQLNSNAIAPDKLVQMKGEIENIHVTIKEAKSSLALIQRDVKSLLPKPLLGVDSNIEKVRPRHAYLRIDLTKYRDSETPEFMDQILRKAQELYIAGNCEAAIELANQSPQTAYAWRIKGACGCYQRSPDLVVNALNKTTSNGRKFIEYVCSREGMTIQKFRKTWKVTAN